MSGDLYRDAHLGIRARLAELEVRIVEREAEVTEAFWETIDESQRKELDTLRDGFDLAGAESLDELARAESMLAAYLDELERLIAALPSVEADWLEVPDEVPDPPAAKLSFRSGHPSAAEAYELRRTFTAMVRERDGDAEIIDDNPVYLARFRERHCPFALRATAHAEVSGQISEVDMCLVTSIPRALPGLLLRQETLVLSLGITLGIKNDFEVGDPSFDGLFVIEGSRAAASLFLVPAVRTQLLLLARFDIPTLHVDPSSRAASLCWRFEPAPKALDAAVRVLVAVREARPSVQFTNG
jgi:hypothetical protein